MPHRFTTEEQHLTIRSYDETALESTNRYPIKWAYKGDWVVEQWLDERLDAVKLSVVLDSQYRQQYQPRFDPSKPVVTINGTTYVPIIPDNQTRKS